MPGTLNKVLLIGRVAEVPTSIDKGTVLLVKTGSGPEACTHICLVPKSMQSVAAQCLSLTIGKLVYIEGRMDHETTSVIVEYIHFLGGKGAAAPAQPGVDF